MDNYREPDEKDIHIFGCVHCKRHTICAPPIKIKENDLLIGTCKHCEKKMGLKMKNGFIFPIPIGESDD